MKYLAAAALAAAFVAAPASASDEVTYRVEVHGGWERVSVGGGKANGEFYGVGVGFDVPVSATMFIGFESNADLSTTKKCFGNVFSGRYCQEGKRDLSANARIGVKAAKDVKIYVLAGYTNAHPRQLHQQLRLVLRLPQWRRPASWRRDRDQARRGSLYEARISLFQL